DGVLRPRQPDFLAAGTAHGAASPAQGSQINGIGRCTMGANDVHGADLHNDTGAADLKFRHTCCERDRNFKSKSGTERVKFAGAPMLPKFASEKPHGFANFGNGAPVPGCYKV